MEVGVIVFVVIGGAGLALLLLTAALGDLVDFGDGGITGTSLGTVTSTVVPNRAEEVRLDRQRERERGAPTEALKEYRRDGRGRARPRGHHRARHVDLIDQQPALGAP